MKLFQSKRTKKIAIVVLLLMIVLIGCCALYVNDYYRADSKAIAEFEVENAVDKKVLEDDTIVYVGKETNAGLIFYPGGKVEYTAYEPLMKSLASEGVLCMLVRMPFNLAVLDVNAADGLQELYPEIESWYIGGHSLGGSMAASHFSKNLSEYEGIVLLGAYSTADLSQADVEVLSIYGSEDKVLNHEKYLEYEVNLPKDFTELIIDGGCHAYFGMYGEQEGDGTPEISNAEQIKITTEAIMEMIN